MSSFLSLKFMLPILHLAAKVIDSIASLPGLSGCLDIKMYYWYPMQSACSVLFLCYH
uniref:Uncharacterized protein n=1 Tax=Arundo donax TaxID=35708 RepID=A0A0A8ZYA4_ARUDO